jgi:hypothetical protein
MNRLLPILLLWLSACASSYHVTRLAPAAFQTTTTATAYNGPNGQVVESFSPGSTFYVVGYSHEWVVVEGPHHAKYWLLGSTVTPVGNYSDTPTPVGTTHDTYTGPRGGHYYYNGNGNKTYVTPQSTIDSHNVQTGPRGGQYYINSHGNKTYIKH